MHDVQEIGYCSRCDEVILSSDKKAIHPRDSKKAVCAVCIETPWVSSSKVLKMVSGKSIK